MMVYLRLIFLMVFTKVLSWISGSRVYLALAKAAEQTGKRRIAERALQKALHCEEKRIPPRPMETIAVMENLGNLYLVPGRVKEALALFERAIQLQEKTQNNENDRLPSLLDGLAWAYRLSNQDAQAESPQRRALELREAKLGADHEDVLESVTRLGQVISDLGKYDEAEKLFARVVETVERLHGPQNLSLVAALNNLAILLDQRGDFRRSEFLYQRAVDIEKAVMKGPGVTGVKIKGHNQAISHKF